MTSIKKRLDYVLNELSNLDTEPDHETSDNVVAALSIIKEAFRESEQCPACCFTYDDRQRIVCDVNGPLPFKEFMKKCKVCQAQIKQALSLLQ
ncbi:MAG TPA: hypothetical protein VK536_00190 [Candidatus Limnocylindrales bacterium]|nr:hypothetical protein [Candidatus Limnocylindrales bacterium]